MIKEIELNDREKEALCKAINTLLEEECSSVEITSIDCVSESTRDGTKRVFCSGWNDRTRKPIVTDFYMTFYLHRHDNPRVEDYKFV